MTDFVIGIIIMLIGIPLTAYVTIHISHSSTKEEALGALSNISKKTLFIIILLLQFIALYFFSTQIFEVVENLNSPVEKSDLAIIAFSILGFSVTISHLVFLVCMMFMRNLIDIMKSHANTSMDQLNLIEKLATELKRINEKEKT